MDLEHPNAHRALAEELAVALRRAGAPAHRVEDALDDFARDLGVAVKVRVFPSALLCDGPGGVSMVDVEPGGPDIERITRITELRDAVRGGVLSVAEARRRLARPSGPRYGRAATIAAFAGASASATPFFGGGAVEVGAAALVGIAAGLLAVGADDGARRLVEPVAAALGALLLSGLAHHVPLAVPIALVTGIIVLLPGFSLTVALTELATGHRVSGTGGLAAGALVLLQLGFGAALGARAAEALWGPTPSSEVAIPLPALGPLGVLPVALGGVALSFSVLLQARPCHVPQVVAACALALLGRELGAATVGPELAGGVAALGVTVAANLSARAWRQPAAVWQLPGLLLLVPGAVGFRAVTAFTGHDVVAGIEAGFGAVFACTTLVAGSLLGSALVPIRVPSAAVPTVPRRVKARGRASAPVDARRGATRPAPARSRLPNGRGGRRRGPTGP